MRRPLLLAFAAALTCMPGVACAEPINLRLSFFTSDRSQIYQTSVKPFVDAVNTAGEGLVHIEVFFSGAITDVQSQLPEVVSNGTADLAYIVPVRTPGRFHDTSVMELPTLFRNPREASRVYLELARDGTLAGYDDFYVVGAIVSDPESVHSRKPTASIADLKGQRIRANNQTEVDMLQRFGAVPVLLASNKATEAVSSETIDGVTFPPFMLFEFGVGRVVTHHFMIGLGGVPTALVMNRKKFESLPPQAQSIVREFAGERLTDYTTRRLEELDRDTLSALEADPRRTVSFPDPADAKAIHEVYDQELAQFAGSSSHNRALLARVEGQLAKMRASE